MLWGGYVVKKVGVSHMTLFYVDYTFIGVARKLNNIGHGIINIFNFMVVCQFPPLSLALTNTHIHMYTHEQIESLI